MNKWKLTCRRTIALLLCVSLVGTLLPLETLYGVAKKAEVTVDSKQISTEKDEEVIKEQTNTQLGNVKALSQEELDNYLDNIDNPGNELYEIDPTDSSVTKLDISEFKTSSALSTTQDTSIYNKKFGANQVITLDSEEIHMQEGSYRVRGNGYPTFYPSLRKVFEYGDSDENQSEKQIEPYTYVHIEKKNICMNNLNDPTHSEFDPIAYEGLCYVLNCMSGDDQVNEIDYSQISIPLFSLIGVKEDSSEEIIQDNTVICGLAEEGFIVAGYTPIWGGEDYYYGRDNYFLSCNKGFDLVDMYNGFSYDAIAPYLINEEELLLYTWNSDILEAESGHSFEEAWGVAKMELADELSDYGQLVNPYTEGVYYWCGEDLSLKEVQEEIYTSHYLDVDYLTYDKEGKSIVKDSLVQTKKDEHETTVYMWLKPMQVDYKIGGLKTSYEITDKLEAQISIISKYNIQGQELTWSIYKYDNAGVKGEKPVYEYCEIPSYDPSLTMNYGTNTTILIPQLDNIGDYVLEVAATNYMGVPIKSTGQFLFEVTEKKMPAGTIAFADLEKEYVAGQKVEGKILYTFANGNAEAVEIKYKYYMNDTYVSEGVGTEFTIQTAKAETTTVYRIECELQYEDQVLAQGSYSFQVSPTDFRLQEYYYISNQGYFIDVQSAKISNLDYFRTLMKIYSGNSAYASVIMSQLQQLSLSKQYSLKSNNKALAQELYEITVLDDSIAMISNKRGDIYSAGHPSIEITGTSKFYVNGIKDGTTTLRITHKRSGVSKEYPIIIESLKERVYVSRIQIPKNISDYGCTQSDIYKNVTWKSEDKNIICMKNNNGGYAIIYHKNFSKFSTEIKTSIAMNTTQSGIPYNASTSYNTSELMSGENYYGGGYPNNSCNLEPAVSSSLTLTSYDVDKRQSEPLCIQTYLVDKDTNTIVEHTTQDINVNISGKSFVVNNTFNDKLFTKSYDKYEVVYEVSSDTYNPMYQKASISSKGVIQKVKVELCANRNSVNNDATVLSYECSDDANAQTEVSNVIYIDSDKVTTNIRMLVGVSKDCNITDYKLKLAYSSNGYFKRVGKNDYTLPGMKYTWIENTFYFDSQVLGRGSQSKVNVEMYTKDNKMTGTLNTPLELTNGIRVPKPYFSNTLEFVGEIMTGEIKSDVTGKQDVKIGFPNTVSIDSDYQLTTPMKGTFQMIIGGEGEIEGNQEKTPKDKSSFKKKFEKKKQELKEEYNKNKKQSGFSNELSISGYATGNIDYVDGKWKVTFTGGGIKGAYAFSYEYLQNMVVWVIPVYFGIKVGVTAEVDMLFTGKNNYHDMFGVKEYDFVFDAIVGAKVELTVQGGVGFDHKILALKAGFEGDIGASYHHNWAKFHNDFNGIKVYQGGQLGLKVGIKAIFEFKLLFIKVRAVLGEAAYAKTFYNGYRFPEGRPNLDTYETTLTGPSSVDISFFSIKPGKGNEWTDSLYPYGIPQYSHDGTQAALLYATAENLNTPTEIAPSYSKIVDGKLQDVVSITDWNLDENGNVVDNRIAENLAFDAENELSVMAWQATEAPNSISIGNNSGQDDLIKVLKEMNNNKIYVSVKDANGQYVTRLLSDEQQQGVANVAPDVAVNKEVAAVVWQRGKIGLSANGVGMDQGVQLLCSVYDKTKNVWSTPQILEDGNAGLVQSYDTAIKEDGTVMVIASVDPTNNVGISTEREIYGYCFENGQVKKEQLTTSSDMETAPSIVTKHIDNQETFVASWLRTEGMNQIQQDENTTITSILRISTLDNNLQVTQYVESLETEIPEQYKLIASNSTDIEDSGIAWVAANNDGEVTSYIKRFIIEDSLLKLSRTYELEQEQKQDNQAAVLSFNTVATKNGEDITFTSALLYQEPLEKFVEGVDMVIDSTQSLTEDENAAYIVYAGKKLQEELTDVYALVENSDFIQNSPVAISLDVRNTCSRSIQQLKIKVNNSEDITIDCNIESGDKDTVTVSYIVPEVIPDDAEIVVTPVLSNGKQALPATTTITLNMVDISITLPEIVSQENKGLRNISMYLSNTGTRSVVNNYVLVKVLDASNELCNVIPLSSDVELVSKGLIAIKNKEVLEQIERGSYNLVVQYTPSIQDYDNNGICSLVFHAFAYKKDGNTNKPKELEDKNYADNTASISIVNPSKVYANQYVFDVTMDEPKTTTEADIRVSNLYSTKATETMIVELHDNQGQVIEEKQVDISLEAEEYKNYNVSFSKIGNLIQCYMVGKPLTVISNETTNTGGSTTSNSNNDTDTSGQPLILGDDIKGWVAIEELLSTYDGESKKELTIELNKETVVPKGVLNAIVGKNVVLILKVSDSFAWRVYGKNIVKEVKDDFAVSVSYTSKDQLKILVGEESKNAEYVLDKELIIYTTADQIGKIANLYYSDGTMKLVSVGKVSAIKEVSLTVRNSGIYEIIYSDKPLLDDVKDQLTVNVRNKTLYYDGTTGKTKGIELVMPEVLKEAITKGLCVSKITYSTSKKSVATVSKTGKVTSKKAGTATITMKAVIDGKTYTYKTKITVKKSSIIPTSSKIALKKGKATKITVKLYGYKSTDLIWENKNKSIVSVNPKTGEVKGKKKGTATIIIHAGKLKKTVTITVK